MFDVSAAKPPRPDRANHQPQPPQTTTMSRPRPLSPVPLSPRHGVPRCPVPARCREGGKGGLTKWQQDTGAFISIPSCLLVNGNPPFLLVVAPPLSPFSNLRNGLKSAASSFSGFFRLPIIPIFVVYIHIYMHTYTTSIYIYIYSGSPLINSPCLYLERAACHGERCSNRGFYEPRCPSASLRLRDGKERDPCSSSAGGWEWKRVRQQSTAYQFQSTSR